MGNTPSLKGGGSDALEGVFGDGREDALCGPSASRRADGGLVPRVWDLPQDRLQDLRSLSGMRHSGSHGPKPAPLSLCQPASLPGRELHPERKARTQHLGCTKDSRAPDPPIFRDQNSSQEHNPCVARSLRLCRAPWARASARARNRSVVGSAPQLGCSRFTFRM